MPAPVPCSECHTPNRAGLLFCVVCGRRLPRMAFGADAAVADRWPGPEVRAVSPAGRPSALAWASLLAALLGWSFLPLLGAAVAVLLGLRAEEKSETPAGHTVLRVSLWLGGTQLVLALAAGAAMGAVALVALWRGS